MIKKYWPCSILLMGGTKDRFTGQKKKIEPVNFIQKNLSFSSALSLSLSLSPLLLYLSFLSLSLSFSLSLSLTIPHFGKHCYLVPGNHVIKNKYTYVHMYINIYVYRYIQGPLNQVLLENHLPATGGESKHFNSGGYSIHTFHTLQICMFEI